MKSRQLVDPALAPLLDALPPFEFTIEILPAVRSVSFPIAVEPTPPDAVVVTTVSVPGPAGAPAVELTIYTPKDAKRPLPAVFHVHGGGFVAGNVAELEPLHRSVVLEANCILTSVNYRLAPETPFPGAIEDCYAALGWVFGNAARLGIDATRIGVMGESAGGGLAAALALVARDRKEYALAFQHLIYPMLDDRTCTSATPHPFAGEFVWTASSNSFGWSALLGHAPGLADVSPYAAPARATDLSALPPTYLATAALDLFVEEDLEYARRLLRSGVPLELQVYPGAFHAFDLLSTAPISMRARRDSIEALKRALHPAAS